jgi:hypothetical protein
MDNNADSIDWEEDINDNILDTSEEEVAEDVLQVKYDSIVLKYLRTNYIS